MRLILTDELLEDVAERYEIYRKIEYSLEVDENLIITFNEFLQRYLEHLQSKLSWGGLYVEI